MANGEARTPCGVKTFCATLHAERAVLGDVVTAWLQANPSVRVLDRVVAQSSDHTHHCLTIVLFYEGAAG